MRKSQALRGRQRPGPPIAGSAPATWRACTLAQNTWLTGSWQTWSTTLPWTPRRDTHPTADTPPPHRTVQTPWSDPDGRREPELPVPVSSATPGWRCTPEINSNTHSLLLCFKPPAGLHTSTKCWMCNAQLHHQCLRKRSLFLKVCMEGAETETDRSAWKPQITADQAYKDKNITLKGKSC